MQKQFKNRARSFILKAIRIRRAMLMEGSGRMNVHLAKSTVEELEFLLKKNKHDSDENMGLFWRRKGAKILGILPGLQSDKHKSMLHEFQQLELEHTQYFPS
ncbi:hypothetical protein DMA11_10200 [Marinilabiliaceae bacterium JC017]|nr:hypothetical protein DMA11_10200 [Marinilabiliaceae bacterium JC017]